MRVSATNMLASRILGAGLGLAATALAFPADAGVKTLHNFPVCAVEGCKDGSGPVGNLVRDAAGNYYGVATEGGEHGLGSVFQLAPDGNGGFTYQTLHSFCEEPDCDDGAHPNVTLVIDEEGNLYGTTASGGGEEGSGGIAFKLDREEGWKLDILHEYCGADAPTGSQKRGAHKPPSEKECEKAGATPIGGFTYKGASTGVPYDGESPLYGASMEGPEGEGGGIVYQLKPPKEEPARLRKRGREEEEGWPAKKIFEFCSEEEEGGPVMVSKGKSQNTEDDNCDGGKNLSGRLFVDKKGDIYGTTFFGGEDANFEGGGGVVFKLTYDPEDKAWDEVVLHKFCSEPNCRDGRSPAGGLTMDATGNLFGATEVGGKSCGLELLCGVVFMISPNGEQSVSRVLHYFCTAEDCADGATPQGSLVMDSLGNLYGATINGGAGKGGVVFRLQPDGKLKVLHPFCAKEDCADGRAPNGVVLDESGNLFGVTTFGGKKEGGTVFQITPEAP